jgi:iron-sulfur cluster assembly protein
MEKDVNYQVFVSTEAAEQIKSQLIKRGTPTAFLRLGVKGGGCLGYEYVIQFEDSDPRAKDLVFEKDGVSIIVDNKSLIYLNGSTLSWERNLMKRGFKIINPNEKSSCGCGMSISLTI